MELNAKELALFLSTLFANGATFAVPAICGESGIGKTSICAQAAARCGMEFVVLPVSQLNPEDLGLLTNDPSSTYAKFQLSTVFDVKPGSKGKLVALDELNRPASDTVMNFVMGMVCERMLYGMPLDPRIIFVATLNPTGTGEYPETRDIFADLALRRRFNTVTLGFDPMAFLEYGRSVGMDSRLLEFLTQFPAEILVSGEKNCPRLWEMFSTDVLGRGAREWGADRVGEMRVVSSMYMTASTASKWVKFWQDLLESFVSGDDILEFSTKTKRRLAEMVEHARMDMIDASTRDLLTLLRRRETINTKELNGVMSYIRILPSQQAVILGNELIVGPAFGIQGDIQNRLLKKDMQAFTDLINTARK